MILVEGADAYKSRDGMVLLNPNTIEFETMPATLRTKCDSFEFTGLIDSEDS